MKKIFKAPFTVIGMAVGIVLIIIGIFIICGGVGSASAFCESTFYDYGYASFGTDYYTFSSNNAYAAASAATAVNSNVRATYKLLEFSLGMLIIGIGAADFCAFGIVLFGSKNNSQKAIKQSTNESNNTMETAASSDDKKSLI